MIIQRTDKIEIFKLNWYSETYDSETKETTKTKTNVPTIDMTCDSIFITKEDLIHPLYIQDMCYPGNPENDLWIINLKDFQLVFKNKGEARSYFAILHDKFPEDNTTIGKAYSVVGV